MTGGNPGYFMLTRSTQGGPVPSAHMGGGAPDTSALPHSGAGVSQCHGNGTQGWPPLPEQGAWDMGRRS